MTQVNVTADQLLVEMRGWDKLWSFKSRLAFPLAHVSGIRMAENEKPRGLRAPGTFLPGLVIAGTFHQVGRRVFWSVHHRARAVAIELRGERLAMLVLEVKNPAETIAAVRSALASMDGFGAETGVTGFR